jgi:ketosteroid isomerase-like protein
MRQTTSEKADVQPLEKKSVKRWVKEWRNLLEEERGLESCMSKLEEQGDNISTEVINPLIVRYKDRLKSLQPLHQEIEKELESIRKRTTREIDLLEDQLKPVQKRLEEFQSLYRESALTKADFQRESQELRKEIKSIERGLKKFRHLLSLLPGPVGENVGSSEFAGGLLRPLTLTTGGVILFLIIAGGYLFWQKYPPSVKPISVEVPSSASPLVSLPDPETVMESKKVEKIESVFENIRRANLQKDIDLFMSCFSRDFRGAERKRKDTLKMWETFNYHDLFYDLKKQTISGDTADVRLEWVIRTSEKVGGKPHNGKTVLDVTLKREDSRWKIKGIKPVS